MIKTIALVLLCASACGGKLTSVPPVPTVSDAGTRLPTPDGQMGNPDSDRNSNRTNAN